MIVKNKNITRFFLNNINIIRQFWSASLSANQVVQLEHKQSGETLQFPSVWLRDNCQCSQCFSETLYSRLIPCKNFQGSILPKSISCANNNPNEAQLLLKWPDKHESKFNVSWLREHSFDEKNQLRWLRNYSELTNKITWKADSFEDILHYFSYEKVMTNDTELLKWLIVLNKYGLAVLQGMGTDKSEIEKLANRIGFSKRTTYGSVYVVEAKPDATNSAYQAAPLGLHVDLPYYNYMPSVNLLHFAVQSSEDGEGTNQLVDGLEVSKQIKQYNVEMYKVLATTPVEWTDKGKDSGGKFHHVHRAPVICENDKGQVVRINFNQPQRDPQFSITLQQAIEWYKCMDWFTQTSYNPQNMVELKISQGDLLSFDNTRILHGRSGYSTERSVVGTYMDWDIIHSKMRVLFADLGLENIDDLK